METGIFWESHGVTRKHGVLVQSIYITSSNAITGLQFLDVLLARTAKYWHETSSIKDSVCSLTTTCSSAGQGLIIQSISRQVLRTRTWD